MCHRAVTPAIVFESILRVTVVSVQGSLVYLEWNGTSGSFGIFARPLEFLSTFNLRAPPLDFRWEHQDSFLTKPGKGPSSRDEEGKMVLGSSLGLSRVIRSGDSVARNNLFI